jgi:hypothetical protein
VLIVIVMVMMLVLMVVAAAAVLIVVVVMMLVLMVVTAAAMLIVIVMVMMLVLMLMIVTAAAVLIMVVVMMLLLMVVTAAAMLVVIMVMVGMVMGMLQSSQLCCQGCFTLHSFQQLRARQFAPGGGNNGCSLIVLTKKRHCVIQLLLGDGIGTGQNDGSSGFHLVIIELAKVLHVDLHLICIHNCHSATQNHVFTGNLLNSTDDIGQFANTGGFNDNAVRMVVMDDLGQGLAKIAHQAAANTTGVHLGNIDAGFLQETAVNADLTEFVFDQHDLLALVGFFEQLSDERGLTGTEEAGENINFGHKITLSYLVLTIGV